MARKTPGCSSYISKKTKYGYTTYKKDCMTGKTKAISRSTTRPRKK